MHLFKLFRLMPCKPTTMTSCKQQIRRSWPVLTLLAWQSSLLLPFHLWFFIGPWGFLNITNISKMPIKRISITFYTLTYQRTSHTPSTHLWPYIVRTKTNWNTTVSLLFVSLLFISMWGRFFLAKLYSINLVFVYYCQTQIQVKRSSPSQKDNELTLFYPCHHNKKNKNNKNNPHQNLPEISVLQTWKDLIWLFALKLKTSLGTSSASSRWKISSSSFN